MGRSHDLITPKMHTKVCTACPAASAKTSHKSGPAFVDMAITWMARLVTGLSLVVCYMRVHTLQKYVDNSWIYLRSTWIFNSVYFETWWTTLCFALVMPLYPFAIHFLPVLEKYKIHPSVTYVHQSVLGMLKEAFIYMAPLMTLDTFIVKKYHGVDPNIWYSKRQELVQYTRALPISSPSVSDVVLDLTASIITFDALFFAVHYLLHRNIWLYKRIHAYHHDHDVMHAHVVNKLTVVERLTLVLSANFALKLFNSHPFTRMLFVPVFVSLLIENHTGYDFPFGLHQIIPFDLFGGSVKHYAHHVQGSRHYQPFLTYLDKILDKSRKKGSFSHRYQF